MTEQEAVRLLEWNGMPLSCHLMLTAGPRASLGLLSPERPPHRARRPVHRRLRRLGRVNCRAGFVVGGRSGAARRDRRLRRRGSSAPTSRRWSSGTGRFASARPAASSRRSSTAASATPSSGSSSTRGTRSTSTSGSTRRWRPGLEVELAVGHGAAGRHHPGDRHRLLHHQHRGRHRPRRREPARTSSPPPTPRRGGGSRRAAASCRRARASSCTPTCSPSPTSPPTYRRSCWRPTGR